MFPGQRSGDVWPVPIGGCNGPRIIAQSGRQHWRDVEFMIVCPARQTSEQEVQIREAMVDADRRSSLGARRQNRDHKVEVDEWIDARQVRHWSDVKQKAR